MDVIARNRVMSYIVTKINLRIACEKCFSFLIVVRRQILKTVFADKSALTWNF